MNKVILYITNGLSGSGGLERVVSLKASYFADEYKYKVHIITLNEDDKTPYYPLSSNVVLHNITTGNGFKVFLKNYYSGIKQIISEIRPDVIFVADDGLKGLYTPLMFRCHSKFIYERHTTKAIHGSGIKSWILRFLMDIGSRFFDNFVVLTEHNKKEWRHANGITVIPNPLPFECDSVPPILGRKKIISVGSMSYIKGHDVLIKAWGKICTQFPEYTIHIYGAPKENYHNLVELIEAYKLKDQVFLHKPTKYIKDKYLESCMCILPSRVEGFGMVLIEAMECGCPCIATDCEGPIDIIETNCSGIIVEKDNASDLARNISDLLINRNLSILYSSYARDAAKKYQLKNVASMWNQLIEN